jgi:phage gpG-like protein
MAGVSLKIESKDLERGALRRLKQLGGRMENPRPVLLAIGEYMLLRTEERFSTEKDPDGQRWKELSPLTLLTKKHTKILTESGNLRGRITYRVEPAAVRIGNNVVYGAIHQLGGTIRKNVTVGRHWRIMTQAFGRPIPARHVIVESHERQMNVTIPARKYLGANQVDLDEFDLIIVDYLTGD